MKTNNCTEIDVTLWGREEHMSILSFCPSAQELEAPEFIVLLRSLGISSCIYSHTL
jgi:hypothetical protein